MMWTAWRQHRSTALYTLIGLGVLVAALVVSGLQIHGDYNALDADGCLAGGKAADLPEGCRDGLASFSMNYSGLGFGVLLLSVAPLLLGLFWGAPLIARELEHGTHRLAWTQGISRRRWAVTSFGMVVALSAAAATVYSLVVMWWSDPLYSAGVVPRFEPIFFGEAGIVPIAYTLFAVAAAIYAGGLVRKTIAAMGITLAGFVVVRVVMAGLVRPRFMATEVYNHRIDEPQGKFPEEDGWLVSSNVRNPDGEIVAANSIIGCDGSADCGFEPGTYNSMEFHPAERFWPFQFIESGIFVALAAVLLYLAYRRVRRLS